MEQIFSVKSKLDEVAMETAETWAKMSHCLHYQVAAVFIGEGKRVLAIGYNGPPKGQPHCDEVGCAKEVDGKMLPPGSSLCRGAHAEMNGIGNAAANGVALANCLVYCTYSPCYDCAKHLVNLRIKEFIYKIRYEGKEGDKALELFQSAKIPVRQLN